jgi:NADPH:quinone reductase-like Zn-dependent oxidoreductase
VLSSAIPDGINSALAEAMAALNDGRLKLRPQVVRPLAEVATAHAELGAGTLRSKVVLAV